MRSFTRWREVSIWVLGAALSSCHGPNEDVAEMNRSQPLPPANVAPTPEPSAKKRHPGGKPGVLLEDGSWQDAEGWLTPESVVVIPLGGSAKEHGLHLKLKNDFTIAEYFKGRVLAREDVVVAPTIGFGFYPAFTKYPGSISLRLETATNLIVDVVTSLAAYGPKRFYVLNTGVSTVRSLEPAAKELGAKGILLRYTNLVTALGPVEKEVGEQEGGTHADEIETSMMLIIDPANVDMSLAQKDYHPDRGNFTRDPDAGEGTYSPTGAWGDPTLATPQKGQKIVKALEDAIIKDIQELRTAPLP